MAAYESFDVGHRVAHITNGDGVVSSIEDGCICVTFDRKTSKGKSWVGKYDRRWFDLHPSHLFHRTDKKAPHDK